MPLSSSMVALKASMNSIHSLLTLRNVSGPFPQQPSQQQSTSTTSYSMPTHSSTFICMHCRASISTTHRRHPMNSLCLWVLSGTASLQTTLLVLADHWLSQPLCWPYLLAFYSPHCLTQCQQLPLFVPITEEERTTLTAIQGCWNCCSKPIDPGWIPHQHHTYPGNSALGICPVSGNTRIW